MKDSSLQPLIYLDFAAATPLAPEVEEAMRPYFREHFANPRALHRDGRANSAVVENARRDIARRINASADELYFTSGGTDANTRAFLGVVNALQDSGRALSDMHIIVSMLEHPSVRACAEMLARRGVSVSYAPVAQNGAVDADALIALIKENTVLVSMMFVNNELGTVQPVLEVAKAIRAKREASREKITPLLHTDATQAPLTIALDVRALGVDLMTLDAYKMYGPAGVGALFVRNGAPYAGLSGTLHKKDVDQGGTPNVAGIVGFAKAYALADERREDDAKILEDLRHYMESLIEERFPDARINGRAGVRTGGIVNITVPNLEGEFLVAGLSERGIAASAKSACLSGGGEGSYVIASFDPDHANNTVRFSFGRTTTRDDIDVAISVLSELIP